jgi:hypothetical protein
MVSNSFNVCFMAYLTCFCISLKSAAVHLELCCSIVPIRYMTAVPSIDVSVIHFPFVRHPCQILVSFVAYHYHLPFPVIVSVHIPS